MRPEQMRITGLPVDPRFMQRLTDKAEARAELGWDAQLPAVLMVAGGDGMGRLFETARALDVLPQPFQMAVVAGRNKPLKERLDAASWSHPIHTYPFVRNMPTLMAAADILVTKAGPATITEAAIAGLPMILSDAIPGQEDGNVTYVIESQAGAYCPKPPLVAETVAQWLHEGPDALRQRSETRGASPTRRRVGHRRRSLGVGASRANRHPFKVAAAARRSSAAAAQPSIAPIKLISTSLRSFTHESNHSGSRTGNTTAARHTDHAQAARARRQQVAHRLCD